MFRALRNRRPRRPVLLGVIVAAMLAFPAGFVLASHQFSDVPTSNPFHADIDALVDSGVTAGCASGRYCPKSNVTREQMAAFLNRLGALAPGKTPVVNADEVDGLGANQLTRAAADSQTVNSTTTPISASLMTVTAPIDGGLLIDLNFTCASFAGTTDTRWDIDLLVDGVGTTSIVLFFPHAIVTGEIGASGSTSTYVPVSAGARTISYSASRTGNGSLDCNIATTSLFVPFGDSGATPSTTSQSPEVLEDEGVNRGVGD